jgi:hypothetical protein
VKGSLSIVAIMLLLCAYIGLTKFLWDVDLFAGERFQW